MEDGEAIAFSNILEASAKEVSVYSPDEATGLMRRCRVDILAPEGCNQLFDIKTCRARVGGPKNFARQIGEWEYDIATIHYTRTCLGAGLNKPGMIFVAVESEPPYLVSWNKVAHDSLVRAETELDRRMAIIADCVRRNHWPGYPERIQQAVVANWYQRGE
jgi:hypothetical protein